MNIEELFKNLDMKKAKNIQVQSTCASENLITECKHCGGEKFHEINTDFEDYIVLEKKVICNNCNQVVNYWVTGFYENDISEAEYKRYTRKKKLQRVLNGNNR